METPALWDVWVVPFPYSDRLAEKRRPALIVSGDALLRDHGLVWLAMITSTRINAWASDVEIGDLSAAGLPLASRVRIAKIATIEPGRLLGRRGRLAHKDAVLVARGLRRFLP